MTMAQIKMENLSLEIPVFDYRHLSIRRKLIKSAVGGVLADDTGLTKIRALHSVNLSINDGDRVGIYGHNGAGKTSLLKVVAGIYRPSAGDLEVRGDVLSLLSIMDGMEPSLSGEENIMRVGLMRGNSINDIERAKDEIIDFSGLNEFSKLPVRTYSSGMQMRLIFSIVTSFGADILLLDEFFSTGDESFKEKSLLRLQKLVTGSKILMFASHSKQSLRDLCNRILVLEKGFIKEIPISAF